MSLHTTPQPQEKWQEAPGFPHYLVSSFGRIKNTLRGGNILIPSSSGYCYLKVTLCDDGKKKHFSVHRLVFETFNGACNKGLHVMHLNGDGTDNRLDNLRMGSPTCNNAFKVEHGTDGRGESNPMAKLTMANVLEMRKLREAAQLSFAAIGKIFNVSTMTAYRAVTKQSWGE